jgi:TatD DNase family protein
MKLIDAHCHLESQDFSQSIDSVLKDAEQGGIDYLVTCATMSSEWSRSRSLHQEFHSVHFALGIHPWFIHQEEYSDIENRLPGELEGAVALGEIGLDNKVEQPMENQIHFLELQLAIAKERNVPVVIHCRGAYNELFSSVKRVGISDAGAMIHSFGGSKDTALAFIPLGFTFSLGGILTRTAGSKRITMMQEIYPRHIMLESDSPAMLPAGLKGDRNEPANLIHNCNAGAKMLGIEPSDFASSTYKNSLSFFALNRN